MKKHLAFVLALCLLLTGCSGLPAAREMGDMALLRTMGVDAGEGGIEVTVSTGPRAKGLQAEGEAALVLSAKDSSLSGACLAMQGLSDSYVFYGYVDQLLLGEGTAKAGIKPVLEYFARDVELGLGAQLWLVRESTARQAVSSGGDSGVEQRLSTLRADGKMGVAAITRTAGDVYTDLMERGAAFVPALAPAGEEDTSLVEKGYGILKDGKLVGYLEGEEARGLELLAGRASAEVLTSVQDAGQVSARIVTVKTTPKVEFKGETPEKLKLSCWASVKLTEYQRPLEEGQLQELEETFERQLLDRMRGTLSRLQGWGADCLGFGPRGALAHPGKWERTASEWPERFAGIEPEISLQVTVHP